MGKVIQLFLLCFWAAAALGQGKPLNPPKDTGPKSKIELVRADSLVGINNELTLMRFIGNVVFKHRGATLYCNTAVQNSTNNLIEAYGNVKINQGDTLTITGDTLFYNGNTRFAEVFGRKVVLTDDDVSVTSRRMNYNLNTNDAYYSTRGTIRQDSSVLMSDRGNYNTQTKVFNYEGNVVIEHPDYTLKSEKLDYDSNSKIATFLTPTEITSDDGILKANAGTYNTSTQQAIFTGRSGVSNEDYALDADSLTFNRDSNEGFAIGNVYFMSKDEKNYTLESDTLFFNRDNDFGYAIGNVTFTSGADKIRIDGRVGIREGKLGQTKMMGDAILRSFDNPDTLFMAADTLYAYELVDALAADSSASDSTKLRSLPETTVLEKNSVSPPLLEVTETALTDSVAVDSVGNNEKKIKLLIADGHVKVFRSDFQSLTDSLRYDMADSTITFYTKPILWSGENQLQADTIQAFLRNDKIKNIYLRSNSFVISQDSALNFNQIKGRQIQAIFDDSTAIERVYVDGNGESIYFAMDDKNRLIGLNRVECSRMILNFREKKVRRIAFIGRPEARLIPPHEIGSGEIKLSGFAWRIEEKPDRAAVLGEAKPAETTEKSAIPPPEAAEN